MAATLPRHARIDALRELVAALDKAQPFAKLPIARDLFDQTLTLLAEMLRTLDWLEQRVEVANQGVETLHRDVAELADIVDPLPEEKAHG